MTVVKLKPRVNRLPQTQEEMTRKVREPDEFMTTMQNVINDSGKSWVDIAADAMVHYQTVRNIAEGATRYPANSTCDRILAACGYRREVMRVEGRRKKA